MSGIVDSELWIHKRVKRKQEWYMKHWVWSFSARSNIVSLFFFFFFILYMFCWMVRGYCRICAFLCSCLFKIRHQQNKLSIYKTSLAYSGAQVLNEIPQKISPTPLPQNAIYFQTACHGLNLLHWYARIISSLFLQVTVMVLSTTIKTKRRRHT